MLAYMRPGRYPGRGRPASGCLVAVSGSPLSERLVRTAKRLADELKADWLALYVETPGDASHPELREQAMGNLALAERLGARVDTLPGPSIAETLVDYARRHNVTKIIAGKPLRPRWRELLGGSVVDRVIKTSGAIDVYVISSGPPSDASKTAPARPARPWQPYLYSLPPVVLATLIGWPLTDRIEPTNLVMLYLAAVVVAAVYLGRGPAILTAFLSVVAFDFFFVPPHFTFAVSDTQYLLTFAGLFVVGLVVSSLAARVREQARAAQRRELQTSELYELSRELAGAAGPGADRRGGALAHPAGARRTGGGPARRRDGNSNRRPDSTTSTRTSSPSPCGRSITGRSPARAPTPSPGAALMYLPLRDLPGDHRRARRRHTRGRCPHVGGRAARSRGLRDPGRPGLRAGRPGGSGQPAGAAAGHERPCNPRS